MGKRQNRVVPILLLGNHAMSAEKDANSPSRDTKNTDLCQLYKGTKDLFYAYQLLPVEHQINK